MHIAFVSLGAFGHVNPTLQLASELVARGERVCVVGSTSGQA